MLVSDDATLAERVRRALPRAAVTMAGSRSAAEIAGVDLLLLDSGVLARPGGKAWLRKASAGRTVLLVREGETRAGLDEPGMVDWFDLRGQDSELALRVERARRAADIRRPRKSDVLVGGPWTTELFARISSIANTDSPITIRGESGTGKELVARLIHQHSPRAAGPFVAVNCAAIPDHLLEDELFGHVRGAFTDATRDRDGLFALADGGTVFLDEIGEMPLRLQASLLRVLQTHEFRRIGDDRDSRVDVRVISATHRNLEAEVEAGRFRADLYFRVHVLPVALPPLRDRKSDIPLLAQHFIQRLGAKLGKPLRGISAEALERLSSHGFPGNVRELENIMHHAAIVAHGDVITAREIALAERVRPSFVDTSRTFREQKQVAVAIFEKEYLSGLLAHCEGNVAQMARLAGMDRKNVWQLLRKYELSPATYRGNDR